MEEAMEYLHQFPPRVGIVLLLVLSGCCCSSPSKPEGEIALVYVAYEETNLPGPAATLVYTEKNCCLISSWNQVVQAHGGGLAYELTPGRHMLILIRRKVSAWFLYNWARLDLQFNVEAGHRYRAHSAYEKERGFYFWIADVKTNSAVTEEIKADWGQEVDPEDLVSD
jgi:hypothetical protein